MVVKTIPWLSPSYVLDGIYYFKEERKFRKEDFSISALIPARNEEKNIKGCLDSLLHQLYKLEKIVVIDDNSSDRTAEIVKNYPTVELIRNETHKGKAESVSSSLNYIDSELALVVDGDTILDKHFTDEIRTPFSDPKVGASTGTVFSIRNKSWIERARLPEYIFYQYFRKIGQSKRGALYTIAGCAAAFRTELLKKYKIPKRTEVEDMDLTWLLQEEGYDVIYWPKAIAYTQEPKSFKALTKQLRRWYSGMWQTLFLHGRKHIQKRKRLASTTWLQIFENLPFSFFYLSLPLLAYCNPLWASGFIAVDAVSLLAPTIYYGKKLGKLKETVKGLPYYYLLRALNCSAAIHGFFKTTWEYVRGKRAWSH